MPDGRRLWRTEAGDLVEDGHPEAVLLAYGVGDSLSADDENRVRSAKRVAHTSKASRTTPKKK